MGIVDRGAVRAPVLPKETVTVEAIGGDVVVRGLLLDERLALTSWQRRTAEPREGESDDDARQRASAALVPRLLSVAVLAGDQRPVWSEEQWREFGSTHLAEALRLFDVASRLAGMQPEATEKN